MSELSIWDWDAIALVVLVVVQVGLSFVPVWQRILVLGIGWFAGGLGIPDALDAKLRRRASLRSRWGGIGTLAVFLVAFVPIRLELPTFGREEIWICLGASSLGWCLGVAISSLVMQLGAASDGPRIARARVVVVRDYISLPLHLLAWLTWAVGTVVTVIGASSGYLPGQSVAIDAFAGVSLVLFELGGRALVRRGQPAGSTDELIWDDALRSSTLRDLLQAGALPVFFGATAFASPSGGIATTSFGILVVVILAEAIIYRLTRRYYLARLWPGARKRTPYEEAQRDAESAITVQ